MPSSSEIQRRYDNIRAAMSEQGVDALIVCGNQYAGFEGAVFYSSGFEIVHRYVEQMDKYYGNVCELDIIFNFQKAYFILDELLLAGELQESSKKNVLRCISQEDSLEDMEVSCA